jgi:NAD/NADP transhydrogenase beta subunit
MSDEIITGILVGLLVVFPIGIAVMGVFICMIDAVVGYAKERKDNE